MRRMFYVVVIAVVAAAATAGLASASGSSTKLQLRKTRVGTILVNSRGFTVYAFTKDGRNRDNCSSACRGVWPPVTTSGRVLAGRGVRSGLIGTIKLRSGVKQVTYAGHPLYTYIADSSPGQTFYINVSQFGGRWPALNATGGEVK